jgi:hypothetical protein
MGRSDEGAQTPTRTAEPDSGGHGVRCVYGASGTGRFHVIGGSRFSLLCYGHLMCNDTTYVRDAFWPLDRWTELLAFCPATVLQE